VNPSVDDRLSSIIRSLIDVILPALPRENSLAQEQAYLAIGHLKIIQAQFDATPGFEADELADARALAAALLDKDAGGTATTLALMNLRAVLSQATDAEGPRKARIGINAAINKVIESMAEDASPAYREYAAKTLVRMQSQRVLKDRRWFALMGFDSDILESA
jgi:hypothetical protein